MPKSRAMKNKMRKPKKPTKYGMKRKPKKSGY